MNSEISMPSALPQIEPRRRLDMSQRRLRRVMSILDERADAQRVKFGPVDLLFVSEPKLVHAILVEHAESFRKSYGLALFARPLLGDGLLTSEGDTHKRQRRMLAPAFGPRRIAGYADIMVQRAERAADALLAQPGEIDLADASMRLTLEIVAKTLFDAEAADSASEFGGAVSDVLRCIVRSLLAPVPMPPFIPTPNNLGLHAAVRRLDRIVYRIIAERRAEPTGRGDLLETLLTAKHDDGTKLSDRQIRDEAMTMLVAGHETTANTLAWTMYLLARHPEPRGRLEEEVDRVLRDRPAQHGDLSSLSYTLQVLKEAQRLYPPAYALGRRARRAITLHGQPIARNQVVLLNVMGMQRRADLFAEPDAFMPERFAATAPAISSQIYMPFGAGPRICIGNHFAIMELQLVLATWIRRMRFELRSKTEALGCEPLITLRPRGGVIGRVTAR